MHGVSITTTLSDHQAATHPQAPVAAPHERVLRRLRRFVAGAVMLLLGVAALRLSFVQGLFRKVTIDGPSMAPALCGAHYEITCADCAFPFRCDAEHIPAGGTAVCPNCGFGDNELVRARWAPSDRVLIDRWPLLGVGPKQGDVVAAALSNGELAVKRVAGLAGELLSIRDGDLYLGQQPLRKSLGELREVRLLVHDNDYAPRKTAGLAPRWQASSPDSHWTAQGPAFRRPAGTIGSGIDWLTYHHWPCTAVVSTRGTPAPVCDNDPYNQATSPRELNAVTDILLACGVKVRGQGQLILAVVDGATRFEATIEVNESDPRRPRRIVVQASDRTLLKRRLEGNIGRREFDVEFGLCDRQVLLAIDGRTVVNVPYQRAGDNERHARRDVLHPLAIGADGLEVEVARLRVWRDLYYLDPQGLARSWSLPPLPAGHVALLGDNPPVSIDSRHWEPAGVPRSAILGRVYRPFWSRSLSR